MTISPARARAWTILRPLAAVALGLAGLTCRDRGLMGPGIPHRAALAVSPSLAVAGDEPTVRLDRVRLLALRLPSRSVALDTAASFPAGDAPLALDLSLAITGPVERFELRAQGIAGADTVYLAVDTVDVASDGRAGEPLSLPMTYAGPDTLVASVALAPRDTTVIEGEPFAVRALARRADGTTHAGALLRFVSRDTMLLRMSGAGAGSARAAFGGVWVVATSANGRQDSTRVVALPAVASVAIAPRGGSAVVGDTLSFGATTRAASGVALTGRPIVFSTPDPLVAAVVDAGPGAARLVALAPGTARLVARSGAAADTVVVLVAAGPVASIVIAPDSVDVVRGDTVRLLATLRDARGNLVTGRAVAWAAANPAVASVDAAGLVTGRLADSVVTIVATSEGQGAVARVRVTRRAVASVVATPSPASVTVGAAVTLTARPLDAAGLPNDDHPVIWTALDATVLRLVALPGSPRSVSVEGVRAGTAAARATAGGVTADVAVTVVAIDTAPPVDRIVVEPATASLVAGQVVALAATAFDGAGAPLAGVAFSWSTSDPAVATVSSTGVVTGTGGGTATITASSAGRSGTAALTVRAAITSIDGGPDLALAAIGDTVRVRPVALDAGGTAVPGVAFSFSSLDPAVASVSAAGLVTAHAAGAARVVVSAEGRADTVRVSIALAAAGVTITPRTATLDAIGAELPLAAVVRDAGGTPLPAAPAWRTLDPAVASVSASGVVTALANGAARIVASAGTGADTATITVQQAAAAVEIAPAGALLASLGETVAFAATARDRNGVVIAGAVAAWQSLAPATVSISASGVATALAGGAADVVATVGSAADTVTVAVVQRVTLVALSPDTVRLRRDSSLALAVELRDARGALVVGRVPAFLSRDPLVATVTASGVVTVRGSGITRVVATADGASDSTVVIKIPADIPVAVAVARIDVTPASATLRVGDTLTFAAERVYADGSRRTIAPMWTSSHPGRAAITALGRATARDTGRVEVTAADSAHAGRATVTVLPAPVPTALSVAPGALAGSATAPVTATASVSAYDQGAGITSATFTLTSPSGAQSRSCTAAAPVTGNTRDGAWRCALTLPAGSETGAWRLTALRLVGSIDRTYTDATLAARGLSATVAVQP